MAIGMAMAIILLLSAGGGIEAKLIPLSPSWRASIVQWYRFSNGLFWPFITSDNATAITSSQSTFALGLFSVDFSTTYRMIICLLPFNASVVIDVWNVGVSMSENSNSILRVPADGSELQLVDADSNVVWSVKGTVSALELTESGNLLVYNSSKAVLWQSFDHPTNTLLPGQRLKQGRKMTASNSSISAPYSLVVEPSGVVLYSTDVDPPLPYWVFTMQGTSDYSKAVQQCDNSTLTTMTYNLTNGTDFVFLERNGACRPHWIKFYIPLFGSIPKVRMLRLDSDGNLRHYLYDGKALNKDYEIFSQNDACSLPNFCGSYGVCSKAGQCSCPVQSSPDPSIADVFLSNSTTKGCQPTTSVACDAINIRNQRFFNVSDVTYFSNKYTASLNWSNQEDCVSSCLTDCSCLAAFYEDSFNLSARACYHISNHISSLKMVSADSQKNYSAYLKVQLSTVSKQNSISHTVIIIISIAAAVSFLMLSALAGLIARFYLRKTEDDFLNTMPSLIHRFTFKELETATNGFKHKLGAGGFGAVFSGKLKDGRNVAVKRLEGARQGLKEFEAEVKTLGGISHVNLVRLYGFCVEGPNRLLVYESMANGSLDKWLFVNDDPNMVLPWSTRMAIAMGTAEGLAYLHEGCSDPILHLDIKPQNILLSENFKAKVSDFGMAKLINEDISTAITQVRGTPGYLAPEWPLHSIVTKKCDVYSYGIVLLEIVSGQKVLDPLVIDDSGGIWHLPSWALRKARSGNLMEIVDPKLGENFDKMEAERLIKLGCWCIQENPDRRPSMALLVQMLQGKMELQDPPLTSLSLPTTNIIGHNSGSSVPLEDQYSLDMLVPR